MCPSFRRLGQEQDYWRRPFVSKRSRPLAPDCLVVFVYACCVQLCFGAPSQSTGTAVCAGVQCAQSFIYIFLSPQSFIYIFLSRRDQSHAFPFLNAPQLFAAEKWFLLLVGEMVSCSRTETAVFVEPERTPLRKSICISLPAPILC